MVKAGKVVAAIAEAGTQATLEGVTGVIDQTASTGKIGSVSSSVSLIPPHPGRWPSGAYPYASRSEAAANTDVQSEAVFRSDFNSF